jgi:hypothetical protein
MIKKILFTILLTISISYAQIGNNYSFANSGTSTAYDTITGGTLVILTDDSDEGYANSLPIGFNFNFNGTTYDKFGVSTNGWMILGNGSTNISNANFTNSSSNILSAPFIAPLWDDLKLIYTPTSNSVIKYTLTGTSPNQVLEVEWRNVRWNYNATTAVISFKVKLYENNGKIEFHYSDAGGAANLPSASICIATGTSNYLAVATDFNSASSSSFVTTISTKPADNTLLTFTLANMTIVNSAYKDATTGNKLKGNYYALKRIRVKTQGGNNPLSLTQINLNYTGTSVSDIEDLEIYYTGNSATFNTTTQFGSSVETPSANNNISGTQQLVGGDNYFWVYLKIKNTATVNNTVNYQVSQITISSTNYNPNDSTTAGITIMTGLTGTKTIGTGGNYANLSNAISDLNSLGVEGPVVFEFMNGYTGETFSSAQTINEISGASATNTITFRPASDVTSDIVFDASANKAIVFNASKYVIFDGRPGGTGSNKKIIIQNASTSNPVIHIYNSSQNIELKYLKILGQNTATFSTPGVIYLGTAGSLNNENIKINNCDIGPNGTTYPAYLIYSYASSSSNVNKYVYLENNNFYDWRASSTPTAVYLYSYNSDWVIKNNSFYQTAAYAGTASTTIYAIRVSSGVNNWIEGNKIGGNAPDLSGTWQINGTATTYKFVGIDCAFGTTPTTAYNYIKNNTIANIDFLSSSGTTSGGGTWCGLQISSGHFRVEGNTIGSISTASNIKLTCSNLAWMVGMNLSGSTATDTILNNTICGLENTGSSASSAGVIKTMVIAGSTDKYIANNTIGSTSLANALKAGTDGTSTSATGVVGIEVGSTANNIITNNTIANFASYGTSTSAGNVWGIKTTGTGSTNTILNNTIFNLLNKNKNTSSGTSTPTAGISATSGTTNNIKGNTVYAISSTSGAAVYVAGIVSHTNGNVENNKIYNITANYAGATVVGLYKTSGTTKIVNNMVTVGSEVTNNVIINGIYDFLGTNDYFYNSVYVGGSVNEAGTNSTFAFKSDVTTNTRKFYNNIFVNNRSNTTGTGKHYAVKYGGSSANPTGLTANKNIFYVGGTGGVFGFFNNADVADLANWQTNTGKDSNSVYFNPSFVNTTNDLHLNISAIDHNYDGFYYSSEYSTDFDGNTRNTSIPYIGCDEVTAYPLPVELALFEAKTTEKGILIKWSTASEVNSNKFEVEKNYNGKWEVLSTVNAKGNTNTTTNYEILDKIINSKSIKYRLKMIDNDGSYKYSSIVVLENLKPIKYELMQNYPNPFNPTTVINYGIPQSSKVILKVYNIAGQEVMKLYEGEQEAGYYSINFNGNSLTSGIYIYSLEAGNVKISKKMMLVK